MKYRKKPIVIEAIQYTGHNGKELVKFVENIIVNFNKFYIKTLEGQMEVSINDWVIKGVNGEFYPCKPDIFELTYEEIDNQGD